MGFLKIKSLIKFDWIEKAFINNNLTQLYINKNVFLVL